MSYCVCYYSNNKEYEGNSLKAPHLEDGSKILHRESGPAIEYRNGRREWIKNGKYHRIDGPAITKLSPDCEEDQVEDWDSIVFDDYNYEEDYLFGIPLRDCNNEWFLEGKRISTEEIIEILNTEREDLIKFLLDDNEIFRKIAEKTLKKLDEIEEESSI